MGRGWAERHPEAAAVFERAEAVLGPGFAVRAGKSLREVCFGGPAETLNRTDVSQPAIFVTGVACWHGVCAVAGHDPASAPIWAAAGLSLGEYTALHLSGAVGFEDALRLVALRGEAMQAAAEATPSSMVALIGADEDSAVRLCERSVRRAEQRGAAGAVLVPANFNAPGQVVVSGSSEACDAAEALAGEMDLRATRLAVAGAFHSPLMAPAAARLGEALAATAISPPRCPVLSNVTGEPHGDDAEGIRRRLVEQLTKPVRWERCCRWLAANTFAGGGEPYELAPGRTLAGLMRRIDKAVKVTTHDTPA